MYSHSFSFSIELQSHSSSLHILYRLYCYMEKMWELGLEQYVERQKRKLKEHQRSLMREVVIRTLQEPVANLHRPQVALDDIEQMRDDFARVKQTVLEMAEERP